MVADKMVRTKWYGQNGIRTKWYWTKWYGQNGTDKMVRIKCYRYIINQSHSYCQYDFFINPASNLIPLAFLYVLIIYLCLLVTKYILNSTDFKCSQNIKLYHFVRTILSIPFCPMPFCPYTILSIPFCPYHFVRYHFVRSPLAQLPSAISALCIDVAFKHVNRCIYMYKRVGKTLKGNWPVFMSV